MKKLNKIIVLVLQVISFVMLFSNVSPRADAMMNLENIADEQETEGTGPIGGQEELLELKEHIEGKERMITGDEFVDINPANHKSETISTPADRDIEESGQGLEHPFYNGINVQVEKETDRALDSIEDRGNTIFSGKPLVDDTKVVLPSAASPKQTSELRMHDREGQMDATDVAEAVDRFPARGLASNHKRFELAPEMYYYKYTEVIGVKTDGWKYGLRGAFTHRFSERKPIESLRDIFSAGQMFNVMKLEGRASFGEVDYEGSGTESGIPDYNVEARATFGYDIPVSEQLVFTPYAGLGYRYLYNQFSDTPAKTIGGLSYYSGYDRESTYVYLPLGVETELRMDHGWALMLTGEFDYLLDGTQVSHLEDMHDSAGNTSGLDKLENDQRDGIGWRASLKLTKETPRFDWFNEIFVRYWHIDDSEFQFITVGGGLLCEGNLCSGGIEPDNKTWEVGMSMGAKF